MPTSWFQMRRKKGQEKLKSKKLNVSHLRLDGNERGMLRLFKECRCLTQLDVGNLKLSEHAFQELSEYCTHLVELRACRCDEGVTGSVLDKLSENCRKLWILILEKCSKVAPGGIIKLSKRAHKLTCLRLFDCQSWSVAQIKELAKNCTHLTYLEVDCPDMLDDEKTITEMFHIFLPFLIRLGLQRLGSSGQETKTTIEVQHKPTLHKYTKKNCNGCLYPRQCEHHQTWLSRNDITGIQRDTKDQSSMK